MAPQLSSRRNCAPAKGPCSFYLYPAHHPQPTSETQEGGGPWGRGHGAHAAGSRFVAAEVTLMYAAKPWGSCSASFIVVALPSTAAVRLEPPSRISWRRAARREVGQWGVSAAGAQRRACACTYLARVCPPLAMQRTPNADGACTQA